MAKLCWIHLSDLHLNNQKHGWRTKETLTKLRVDALELQRKEFLNPQFLFITGDLVYGEGVAGETIQAQFNQTFQYVKGLVKALGIPKQNIFIVPGNHDVNRKKVLPMHQSYLSGFLNQDYQTARKTMDEMFHTKDAQLLSFMERLADYRQAVKQRYSYMGKDDRLIYTEIREVDGCKVGIAGLNGAWSCGSDGEKGRLWMGAEWQLAHIREALAEADLKIGLIHHPVDWFAPAEAEILKSRLESTFDFLIHGHEHQAWVQQINNRHIRVAAGAVFGGSSEEFGYNIVSYDPEARNGEVWLRTYNSKGKGGWIAEQIPGHSDERGVVELGEASGPQNPVDRSKGIIGRERDVTRLNALLEKQDVVHLYGMGGIGKTEVVRLLAESRSERYVRLAAQNGMNTEDLLAMVKDMVLPTLDLPETPDPQFRFLENVEPVSILLHLEHTEKLMIKDRFREPETAVLFQALGDKVSGLKLVLEGRERLGLNSFGEYRLRGLDQDAVSDYFQVPFVNRPKITWRLDGNQAKFIHQRLGGGSEHIKVGAHPQAMNLLANLAEGTGSHPAHLLERYPNMLLDKLRETLFTALFREVLSDQERRLLTLCALYRDEIPGDHPDGLNEAVGDPQAFDRLLNRCLLSPSEGEYYFLMHLLIKELASQEMASDMAAEHKLLARIWMADLKLTRRTGLRQFSAATEGLYHLLQAGAYHELDQINPSLVKSQGLSEHLWKISKSLHGQGRHREDRKILELLVNLSPKDSKAHSLYGLCLERIGRKGSEEALVHYREAFHLEPTRPESLANLGRCLLAKNQVDDYLAEVESLPQATREKAMNDYNKAIYAGALQRKGRDEEASQIRMTAIDGGSKHASYYADEAKWLERQDRKDEALRVLELAEKHGAANDQTRAIMGGILERSGEGEKASRLRMKAIDGGIKNSVYYADEAQWQEKQGRVDEALALLERAERDGCADDHTRAIMGGILERSGEGEKASRLRMKAIDGGSKDAVFYNDEAQWLEKQDRGDEALALLIRAERHGAVDEVTRRLQASMGKASEN